MLLLGCRAIFFLTSAGEDSQDNSHQWHLLLDLKFIPRLTYDIVKKPLEHDITTVMLVQKDALLHFTKPITTNQLVEPLLLEMVSFFSPGC